MASLFPASDTPARPSRPLVRGGISPRTAPRLAFHDSKYYALQDGIYQLSQATGDWDPLPDLPFTVARGMSLTSTPHGLVAFGGETDSGVSRELWILWERKWRPIANTLQPRAWHSAEWIPSLNGLLIHGGYSTTTLFDFQLIDPENGMITQLSTEKRICLQDHTVTYLRDVTVVIFGGQDENKHLNMQLFEVDLSCGKVKSIEAIHELAARYGHHTFDFFGCLWITGGFRMGEVVRESGIFVFSNGIWLKLSCADLQKGNWMVVPGRTGCHLFSQDFSESRKMFFSVGQQPILDANDSQLTSFFSRLVEMNLRSDFLKQWEKEHITLLTDVEESRRKLALGLSRKDPHTLAIPVTELISERDQLQQKLARVERLGQKQLERHAKLVLAPRPTIPRNWTHPRELVKKLAMAKEAFRAEIQQVSEQNVKLFENARTQLQYPADVVTRLQLSPEEVDEHLRAMNSGEFDQELHFGEQLLKDLEAQVVQLREKQSSLELSFVDGMEYLQGQYERNFEVQTQLCRLQQKLFEKAKALVVTRLDEFATDKPRNPDKLKAFKNLYLQCNRIGEAFEHYKAEMPKLMGKLHEEMRRTSEIPDTTGVEELKRIAAVGTQKINKVVELQNRSAEIIQEKEAVIAVPLPAPGPASGQDGSELPVKPAPKMRQTTQFSSRTFELDIRDQERCEFYNQVITFVYEVNKAEKAAILGL
jgi:hypothetical protein